MIYTENPVDRTIPPNLRFSLLFLLSFLAVRSVDLSMSMKASFWIKSQTEGKLKLVTKCVSLFPLPPTPRHVVRFAVLLIMNIIFIWLGLFPARRQILWRRSWGLSCELSGLKPNRVLCPHELGQCHKYDWWANQAGNKRDNSTLFWHRLWMSGHKCIESDSCRLQVCSLLTLP